jgi:hypothetical protein
MSNCICIPYLSITVSIVLCLPLHVYNYVENVIKYVLFYMHDIKVMVEKIDLSIKKLLENTLFYLIVGQTKTRKLLLTGLKTKHNITVLRHHVIQFFTWKSGDATFLSTMPTKKSFLFFLNLWSVGKNRQW